MKKRLIITFILIYLFYPISVALACNPAPPTVVIECDIPQEIFETETTFLDDQYSVQARDEGGRHIIYKDGAQLGIVDKTSITIWGVPDKVFFVANEICQNDFDPLIPAFTEKAQKWAKDYRYFLDGSLIFTPYSDKKIARINQENRNLLSCTYTKSEVVNNWLITMNTTQDYCYGAPSIIGGCPIDIVIIAPLHFLLHLIQSPSLSTLPYWVTISLLIALLVYLGNKGELHQILRLNRASVIILLLGVPLFLVIMWSRLDVTLSYLAIYYLLATLIVYFTKQVRKRVFSKN